MKPTAARLLDLVRRKGIIRPQDLRSAGMGRHLLGRLVRQGRLERLSRGLYRLPGEPVTESFTLVQACLRVPGGVVCLLSALQFHGLTTELPHQVWMAVRRGAWLPRHADLPLRVFQFSTAGFAEGQQVHTVDGVKVKAYSPARTVADCFKFRSQVGQDVALAALRDCWRQRKATMDELWHFAKICRVAAVMRPYLESLV